MNSRILTSVGCLLLVAAMMAPSVLSHSERAVLATDLGSGYTGPGSGVANTVSGRYVGSAGPAVAIEAYTYPQSTLATGGMLCDAEVAVDSNVAPDNAGNEPLVDGAFGGTSPTGEVWDDGGNGGACHTHHYSTPGFNTFGCQTGTRAAGGNHAGLDIWVGASCDWKEDQGGTSGETTLLLCIVNSILALNVGNLVADVLVLVQCAVDYVNCLLSSLTNPTASCVSDGTQVCGADGTSDAIIYGYAGVGAAFAPANFPVSPGSVVNGNPPVTTPCSGVETAGVFVWDTVATNGGLPEVYLALTGEIFSVPATGPSGPGLPVCTGPMTVNGGTAVCFGVCYAPGYYTVAQGNPTVTTTISGCASGTATNAVTGPHFVTNPLGIYLCTVTGTGVGWCPPDP